MICFSFYPGGRRYLGAPKYSWRPFSRLNRTTAYESAAAAAAASTTGGRPETSALFAGIEPFSFGTLSHFRRLCSAPRRPKELLRYRRSLYRRHSTPNNEQCATRHFNWTGKAVSVGLKVDLARCRALVASRLLLPLRSRILPPI